MERYSTFWPRFVALFLDGLILGVVDAGLGRIPRPDSEVVSFVYQFLSTNIPYAYVILMVGKYGQTIGKMVMDIKVVDNVTEGKISYYQAFLREAIPMTLVSVSIILSAILENDINIHSPELSTLGFIILTIPSVMLLIWAILELLTMLFDKKNRALHDKMAGTVVIKV